MTTRTLAVVVSAALVVLITGCGSTAPPTAMALLDQLEAAGLVSCDDRREPVPEVVTCEDDVGDVTVGIVEDGLTTVRSTSETTAGPWVVGDDFLIITYDEDIGRGRAIAEALDGARVYTVDGDGEPLLLHD